MDFPSLLWLWVIGLGGHYGRLTNLTWHWGLIWSWWEDWGRWEHKCPTSIHLLDLASGYVSSTACHSAMHLLGVMLPCTPEAALIVLVLHQLPHISWYTLLQTDSEEDYHLLIFFLYFFFLSIALYQKVPNNVQIAFIYRHFSRCKISSQ